MGIRHRVQGLLWEASPLWRGPARRLRRTVSLLAYRFRSRVLPDPAPPRLVHRPVAADRAIAVPAVQLLSQPGAEEGAIEDFTASQTETAVTPDPGSDAPYLFAAPAAPADLPPTHLESMLLAAAAEDLDLVQAGWAAPAAGRFGPSGEISRGAGSDRAGHLLLRRPRPAARLPGSIIGRSVCHIRSAEKNADGGALPTAGLLRSGPNLLRGDVPPGSVLRHGLRPVFDVLAGLPEVDGPRTALFLLPYLAVGGAERLLFDLLGGLRGRYRLLVVTVDPHLASLGERVDECRSLSPHVYTLGDWLPRPAHAGALRHLIRRWRVESLVGWNGTVLLYDELARLRRAFPSLRILNQLFNHSGGWIEHYSPTVLRTVDTHLAVNHRIAHALEADRGVAAERIATIHHAVSIPGEATDDERIRRRRKRRLELGLPEDAVVAATFCRMHPQKRPFDVIRLARRMVSRDIHFLMVGGGPLDARVDRELELRPTPNLTRLPMRHDTEDLLDAVDICLLTSAYEGLPVFLLEGMARGIPCVATAVGEIRYLLRHGGGIVSGRPGDLGAIEAALEVLLDGEHRRREGARARERVVSAFGLDRYVQQYESVIFPVE